MTVHLLVRYAISPLTGVQYLALCGYTSKVRKEYTSSLKPSIRGVTCEKCKSKLEGNHGNDHIPTQNENH